MSDESIQDSFTRQMYGMVMAYKYRLTQATKNVVPIVQVLGTVELSIGTIAALDFKLEAIDCSDGSRHAEVCTVSALALSERAVKKTADELACALMRAIRSGKLETIRPRTGRRRDWWERDNEDDNE